MKHDYDLNELEQIKVRGLNFTIMPRYRYHYEDHDYERFSLDLLDTLVTEGSTAIDIGAHYGIYSLLAAKKAKQVYAFEPVEENYKILSKNATDNAEANITAINKAVSDKPGELTFNIPWASDSAGFYEHPNAESIRKVQVKVAAVDKELKGLKDLSFVKIDTEGHEIHVLEGMEQTLRNNPNAKMLIEFNPECLVRAGYKAEDLVTKLISLDYDVFAVYEDTRHLMRVTEHMTEADILTEGRTYLNFLCLRKNTWLGAAFISHSASMGGGELWLRELVQGLTASKGKFVLPYVVLPAEGPLAEAFRNLPVASRVVPMRGWVGTKDLDRNERDQLAAVNVEAIAALTELITDFKPHVAVTNSITVQWGAVVSRNLGIPHVWSINEFGDKDHDLPFDYPYQQTLQMITEYSQVVLVNSKAVLQHLSQTVPAEKLQLAYQYVPEPVLAIDPPANVFGHDATMKLIITGRIMQSKGQLEAVQALHELRKGGERAELVIMGTTGSQVYEQQVIDYCKKHKLDAYVHLIGHQDNPHDYVAMADVALMCSRSEAYGRVTIEAMQLGKPVIGANTGATPELIANGKTGYIYKHGSAKDLAAQVGKLTNADVRHKMGAAARIHVTELLAGGYDSVLKVIEQTAKLTPEPLPMAGDLLRGAALLAHNARVNAKFIADAHQKELADFSVKYNEVYAAYRLKEAQLTKIYSHMDKLHLRKPLKLIEKAVRSIRK